MVPENLGHRARTGLIGCWLPQPWPSVAFRTLPPLPSRLITSASLKLSITISRAIMYSGAISMRAGSTSRRLAHCQSPSPRPAMLPPRITGSTAPVSPTLTDHIDAASSAIESSSRGDIGTMPLSYSDENAAPDRDPYDISKVAPWNKRTI